jgi:hypothetical protein
LTDLFSITAPLLIRHAGGVKHVMIECFRHPDGLVYLRRFRGREPDAQDMHFVQGEVTGEGPWKIGDAVMTLPGCHGSNPGETAEFAEWQFHAGQLGDACPSRSELEKMARDRGLQN